MLFTDTAISDEASVYVCGISNGYPPYQFRGPDNNATGFDADVARMVFKHTGNRVTFSLMNWNDVMGHLRYSNDLDVVAGMEITPLRKTFFDFTSPYYHRKSVLFILADNDSIKHLEDLVRKRVAGDRHSFVETKLKSMDIYKKIRIQQTQSKEESMQLLKNHIVDAVISPQAVGQYIAKQLDVPVRIIDVGDPGTPVALAVKKGRPLLLNTIETGLSDLKKDTTINSLYREWFGVSE